MSDTPMTVEETVERLVGALNDMPSSSATVVNKHDIRVLLAAFEASQQLPQPPVVLDVHERVNGDVLLVDANDIAHAIVEGSHRHALARWISEATRAAYRSAPPVAPVEREEKDINLDDLSRALASAERSVDPDFEAGEDAWVRTDHLRTLVQAGHLVIRGVRVALSTKADSLDTGTGVPEDVGRDIFLARHQVKQGTDDSDDRTIVWQANPYRRSRTAARGKETKILKFFGWA